MQLFDMNSLTGEASLKKKYQHTTTRPHNQESNLLLFCCCKNVVFHTRSEKWETERDTQAATVPIYIFFSWNEKYGTSCWSTVNLKWRVVSIYSGNFQSKSKNLSSLCSNSLCRSKYMSCYTLDSLPSTVPGQCMKCHTLLRSAGIGFPSLSYCTSSSSSAITPALGFSSMYRKYSSISSSLSMSSRTPLKQVHGSAHEFQIKARNEVSRVKQGMLIYCSKRWYCLPQYQYAYFSAWLKMRWSTRLKQFVQSTQKKNKNKKTKLDKN